MQPLIIGLIVIVFLVLVINFIAHLIRSRRLHSPYGRRGKKSTSEELAAIVRDREVYRRIDLEQARMKKYLELRSRTWELYEEVRQKYANDEPSG